MKTTDRIIHSISHLLHIWQFAMSLWMWYSNLWYRSLQWNIPQVHIIAPSIISIHPNTSSLTHTSLRLILTVSMVRTWSSKSICSKITDLRLTIYYIIQYRWMVGFYQTGFYLLHNGIDLSHHQSYWVSVPDWPSNSLSTNDLLIAIVDGAPPPENTPDEVPKDPQMSDFTQTPD